MRGGFEPPKTPGKYYPTPVLDISWRPKSFYFFSYGYYSSIQSSKCDHTVNHRTSHFPTSYSINSFSPFRSVTPLSIFPSPPLLRFENPEFPQWRFNIIRPSGYSKTLKASLPAPTAATSSRRTKSTPPSPHASVTSLPPFFCFYIEKGRGKRI